jgi:hypothetical protein
MGFEAFINGVKVGDAENHVHGSGGGLTLTIIFTAAIDSAILVNSEANGSNVLSGLNASVCCSRFVLEFTMLPGLNKPSHTYVPIAYLSDVHSLNERVTLRRTSNPI